MDEALGGRDEARLQPGYVSRACCPAMRNRDSTSTSGYQASERDHLLGQPRLSGSLLAVQAALLLPAPSSRLSPPLAAGPRPLAVCAGLPPCAPFAVVLRAPEPHERPAGPKPPSESPPTCPAPRTGLLIFLPPGQGPLGLPSRQNPVAGHGRAVTWLAGGPTGFRRPSAMCPPGAGNACVRWKDSNPDPVPEGLRLSRWVPLHSADPNSSRPRDRRHLPAGAPLNRPAGQCY